MTSNTMKIIARRKYLTHAGAAVRAESRGEWQLAAGLWAQAEGHALSTLSRLWAQCRNEFCINAAQRGWEVRREGSAI